MTRAARVIHTAVVVFALAAAPSPPATGFDALPGRSDSRFELRPSEGVVRLDVVEEVGLQPAGADPDLATGMLLDFGIATEADLRGRSTAHAAYRALVASLDGVQPPRLVRDRLDAGGSQRGTRRSMRPPRSPACSGCSSPGGSPTT